MRVALIATLPGAGSLPPQTHELPQVRRETQAGSDSSWRGPELARMGVTLMLAGNMGGGAVNILEGHGIQVVRGCSGNVREVVHAWLAGKVKDAGTSCQSHNSGGCPGHTSSR